MPPAGAPQPIAPQPFHTSPVGSVVLGPGLNVQRVALNGRNAEYLSGEEPSLGARLAAAYVRGVQSEGVAAVAKHFVGNNQETDRTSTGNGK